MELTSHLRIGRPAREAFVLDDVLEPAAFTRVFEHFRALPYRLIDHDRSDTEAVKHFAFLFTKTDWEANPFSSGLVRLAKEFLRRRGHPTTGVERVYANLNMFGDYQFAHDDGDIWTALAFVNDEWHPDWGGELLLYDRDRPTAPAWAIAPVPGRMVVFDGLILHRGGVPSKHCHVPRISLAMKLERAPRRGSSRSKRRNTGS